MEWLENLTKEELISALRKRLAEGEERTLVCEMLDLRWAREREKATNIAIEMAEISERQMELVAPYRRGNATRFYVPKEVERELRPLCDQYQSLRDEYNKASKAASSAFETSRKIWREDLAEQEGLFWERMGVMQRG